MDIRPNGEGKAPEKREAMVDDGLWSICAMRLNEARPLNRPPPSAFWEANAHDLLLDFSWSHGCS
jgi:hypothetical protein